MANKEFWDIWDTDTYFESNPDFLAKRTAALSGQPKPIPAAIAKLIEEGEATEQEIAEFQQGQGEDAALDAIDRVLMKLVQRGNNSFLIAPADIFADPNFDPNARLIKINPALNAKKKFLEKCSVVSLLFSQHVDEYDFTAFLNKVPNTILPHALTAANGEVFHDINQFGTNFAPPLVNSVMNRGWNIQAILAHPQVNPNLEPHLYKRRAYTLEEKLGRVEFNIDPLVLFPLPAEDMGKTSLEILCRFLKFEVQEHTTETLPLDLLHKHYIDAISGMIDAGAIVTKDAEEIINKDPELRETLAAIHKRQRRLIAGEETDITARDIKQGYAVGTLNKLLSAAGDNEQLKQATLAVRNELPEWLTSELEESLTMLSAVQESDWTKRLKSRVDEHGRNGGGHGGR